MSRILLISLFLFLAEQNSIYAQNLYTAIESIVSNKKMQVGVAIAHLESGKEVHYNSDKYYAMQSAYKFPIAVATLLHMQEKSILLDHKVQLTKKDLLENTWSPIREKYPDGKNDILVTELISAMVSQSDNNACDYLLRWIGGTNVAHKKMQKLGIGGMQIATNEELMQTDWNIQYWNYSTPADYNKLLIQTFSKSVLKKEYHNFLWKVMRETVTGENHLKGLLPTGTTVYHKTGTSAVTTYGLAGAVNDAGIIELPNKKHIVITVFINNSLEDRNTNEKIIAEISKAAYNHFLNQ